MQNTKDTFLLALRDRLAVLNPERTCLVRGVTRPAIVADENELPPEGAALPETFVLRWTLPATDGTEALALDSAVCEISYWTEGSDLAAGMDRGRVLHAMDGELRSILCPSVQAKRSFATMAASAPQTNVFWSDVALQAAAVSGRTLSRTATVTVFGFREAGE